MGVCLALAVACLAALVASAADLSLLWVAAATRPALGLPDPPPWALAAGTLAGVLAIPWYGLGYSALSQTIAGSRPYGATIVRGAGVCAAGFGSAIHGLTGAIQMAERSVHGLAIDPLAVMERWGRLLLPLWGLAAALAVVASWVWARAAWRREAGVPRWMAWTNPVLVTVALAAGATATPLTQALLLPAAPNLAHVVFFAATAAALRR